MSELADESESAPLVPQRNTGREKAMKYFRTAWRWSSDNMLLLLTMTSVIVGTIIGLGTRPALDITEIEGPSDSTRVVYELIKFPGEIFLRMLKMLILPLIVFSLIAGLGSLEAKVAGTLGWKTIVYYLTTTILAIMLGLLLVLTIKPGDRHKNPLSCNNATVVDSEHLDTLDSVLDLLRNLVPDNLFTATFLQAQTHYSPENVTDWLNCVKEYNGTFTGDCSQAEDWVKNFSLSCDNSTKVMWNVSVGTRDGMNVLGIIVFSIAFAIILGRVTGGRKIVQAIAVLNEAIMKLVGLIMWFSPIGIASIIAGKLIEVDDFVSLMEDIGLYFATVMLGLFIHGFLTLPLLYLILTRKNPFKLIRAVLQALLTAFGISSSSATLPVTIRCLEEKFGADSRVTRFMLPVGATINMDGTALYEAVAAVFIAQYVDQDPNLADVIIISITATAASIGAAGIPQAGLVTLLIVLVAVGLPTDQISIILTVDWLLDRFRTVINVLGDSFGVGIVEHHSRRQLDNHPNPDDDNVPIGGIENLPLEERNYTMTTSGHGGEETTGFLHGDQSPRWSLSQSQDSSDKPHVYASDTVDSGTRIQDGQKASVDYGTSHSPPPSSIHPNPQWSLSTQSSPEKPHVFMSGVMDDQDTHSDEDGTKL